MNNPYKTFKGTPGQYTYLHAQIRRKLGKAHTCTNCGRADIRCEWANKSGQYLKDLNDWEMLCVNCHKRKDFNGDPNKCNRGHEMTEDNTYSYPGKGLRECRICRKARKPTQNKTNDGGSDGGL